MKFRLLFLIALFASNVAFADDNIIELEEIVQAEILNGEDHSLHFINTNIDEAGSTLINKSASMYEILDDINKCKKADVIQTDKIIDIDSFTIGFACRSSEGVINTSEVLVSITEEEPKIIRYQKLEFEEHDIQPSAMSNFMAGSEIESVSVFEKISPGMRTLLTFAKVGIPVLLSFKTGKILAPERSDWQKHFIAGAIISGATILTTEGLLRTFARSRGYDFSNRKINLLSSLAGLLSSIAAGIGKEFYDRVSGKGVPESRDALYTAAGGAMVSLTVVIPIDRIFRSRRSRARPIPFAL